MPATYINQRTCDSGWKNWIGTGGDDMRVSQRYGIGLVLLEDGTIPATLATKDQMAAGLPVEMYLINSLVDPDKRHRGNARGAYVNMFIDEKHPPRCREEDTGFGLVRFRRPDPDPERGGIHCGGTVRGDKWDTKVYGKKIDTLTYEFIVHCVINCTLDGDYHGWSFNFAFSHEHITRWPLLLERVQKFLDEYTKHIEREDA